MYQVDSAVGVDWETSPPAVRAQASAIADALHQVLGGQLIGVYVHGSLCLGCFNPRQSDLDILAVSAAAVSPAQRAAIFDALPALSGAPAPLEFSLLVRSELDPWTHPAPYDLHYSARYRERIERGEVPPGGRDPDLAAHVTVVRQTGVALVGPPPAEVLPEVPWEDYTRSILADFEDCLRAPAETYAVLTAARVWATLATGEVHSKETGARWALQRLPAHLRALLEGALLWYSGAEQPEFAGDPALPAYQRFVAATVAGFSSAGQDQAAAPPVSPASGAFPARRPASDGAGSPTGER